MPSEVGLQNKFSQNIEVTVKSTLGRRTPHAIRLKPSIVQVYIFENMPQIISYHAKFASKKCVQRSIPEIDGKLMCLAVLAHSDQQQQSSRLCAGP